MRARWLAAVGVAILGVGVARAQPVAPSLGPSLPTIPVPSEPPPSVTPLPLPPPATPTPTPAVPPRPPAVPNVPGQLPPLLPVPQPQPGPPLPEVPRPGGPPIDYDHGYQYLPEQLPDRSRRLADEVCGPVGRWWVIPSVQLSWASTQPPPGTIRLRVPDPNSPGGMITSGPRLPVAGLDAGRFEAALGLAVGHWFGETNTHGIEASAYFRDANTTFEGTAPGMLVLFPGGADRSAPQVVVVPNGNAAGVVGSFPSTIGTYFATVDVNYRYKLDCTDNYRFDLLAGYRYAFLEDELYLGELPDGTSNAFRANRVAVSNNYHAGQIGLAGEVRADRWFVNGYAKTAFGVVTPEVTAMGLFIGAQGRTGNGFHKLNALTVPAQSAFAVMPTFNVQLGRQVGNHSRVFVGYSFNYLNRVGRLGDALNSANAGLPLNSFWVQSIGFGGEFRF